MDGPDRAKHWGQYKDTFLQIYTNRHSGEGLFIVQKVWFTTVERYLEFWMRRSTRRNTLSLLNIFFWQMLTYDLNCYLRFTRITRQFTNFLIATNRFDLLAIPNRDYFAHSPEFLPTKIVWYASLCIFWAWQIIKQHGGSLYCCSRCLKCDIHWLNLKICHING